MRFQRRYIIPSRKHYNLYLDETDPSRYNKPIFRYSIGISLIKYFISEMYSLNTYIIENRHIELVQLLD